jgi:hypothetical protein
VITNEYFHTVGRPLVLATKNPGQTQLLDFHVQPNPFSAEATFVLKDFQPTGATLFRLLNAQGNVVREESFSGNTFLFNARNLTSGLYLFQMENGGALLTAGKVIIQH